MFLGNFCLGKLEERCQLKLLICTGTGLHTESHGITQSHTESHGINRIPTNQAHVRFMSDKCKGYVRYDRNVSGTCKACVPKLKSLTKTTEISCFKEFPNPYYPSLPSNSLPSALFPATAATSGPESRYLLIWHDKDPQGRGLLEETGRYKRKLCTVQCNGFKWFQIRWKSIRRPVKVKKQCP